MSKSKPRLPKRVTSTFAIVEIKLGRNVVRRLVESSYAIPFTIQGTIDPGKSGIGPHDNVGTEFSSSVRTIRLGKPILQPCDTHGRPYALAKDMKEGVRLQCDGGFTCIRSGAKRIVKLSKAARLAKLDADGKNWIGRLYIDCKDGKHFLDGQLGDDGELVGLYKVKAA